MKGEICLRMDHEKPSSPVDGELTDSGGVCQCVMDNDCAFEVSFVLPRPKSGFALPPAAASTQGAWLGGEAALSRRRRGASILFGLVARAKFQASERRARPLCSAVCCHRRRWC